MGVMFDYRRVLMSHPKLERLVKEKKYHNVWLEEE